MYRLRKGVGSEKNLDSVLFLDKEFTLGLESIWTKSLHYLSTPPPFSPHTPPPSYTSQNPHP
jgi:hypothetical protein